MMYKLTILCVLAVSAFGEEEIVAPDGKGRTTNSNKYSNNGPAKRYRPMEMKGPCDQTMECKAKTFGTKAKASCLGYYSCFRAEFETKETIKCIGSAACQKATFYGNSKKVICSGYRSCENTRSTGETVTAVTNSGTTTIAYDIAPGLWGKVKVSCDGPFACNSIKGGIFSKTVQCDGDAACSNVNPVAMKAFIEAKKAGTVVRDDPARQKIVATKEITCNGKATCRQDNLYGEKQVYCDGDGACRQATITARAVRCHGKRACEAVIPMFTQALEAYGFMGAAGSKIISKDKNEFLNIKAYGFNTLKNAEIAVANGKLKLFAYGWRSAFGAKVYCASADCRIECWSTACKSMVVYYKNAKNDVTITPEACHPNSDDYPTTKAGGVFCPTFMKSNGGALQLEAYGTPESVLDDEFDFTAARTTSVFPEYPESLKIEMQEAAMEDAAFNAAEDKAMDEYLTELMTELDADLEAHLEEAEVATENNLFDGAMTVQSLQQNASSGLVISNVITAFVVFALFAAVSYYYPQCQLAKKGEISPLLP